MSKIRVEIDTEEKTMVVKKDGEVLDNVQYINCSNAGKYNEFYCSINMTEQEDGGMYKYTSLTAKEAFACIEEYESNKGRN